MIWPVSARKEWFAPLGGLVLVLASACVLDPTTDVARRIDAAVVAYTEAARGIHLGDPVEGVLPLLEPTQATLSANERKPADVFVSDGSRVEIHYFRSRRQADGITTDDEFTPYTFLDGKLVAIGWAALGGPMSQAEAPITSTQPSPTTTQGGVVQEGDRTVYDADECIGPIVNGTCRGSVLPRKANHPTCHGEWAGGRCTGPQF